MILILPLKNLFHFFSYKINNIFLKIIRKYFLEIFDGWKYSVFGDRRMPYIYNFTLFSDLNRFSWRNRLQKSPVDK